MAEDKKKVIVYADWICKFEILTDIEAGKLIKHFFRYINDLNPEYPDRITELSFIDIQNTLKRDLKKWEKRAESSRENGKKGGRPKETEITELDILKPIKPVIVNDIVNVTDTVNVNVKVKDNVKVIFNFKNELLKYGFSENLVNDWLIVRKNKKASNTETAFKGFISEIERRPCNLNETLSECVKNSWSGFKWEWLDNLKHNGKTGNKNSNEAGLGDLADKARNILRNFDTENG